MPILNGWYGFTIVFSIPWILGWSILVIFPIAWTLLYAFTLEKKKSLRGAAVIALGTAASWWLAVVVVATLERFGQLLVSTHAIGLFVMIAVPLLMSWITAYHVLSSNKKALMVALLITAVFAFCALILGKFLAHNLIVPILRLIMVGKA